MLKYLNNRCSLTNAHGILGGGIFNAKPQAWFLSFFSSPSNKAGGVSILFFVFLLLSAASGFAQVKDSVSSPKNIQTAPHNKHIDTLGQTNAKPQIKPEYRSPKKAALMSTIIPGLGQAYNKKYWKLPILYGGIAGLAYSINFNQSRYIKYVTAYKYRLDGNPLTIDNYPKYTDADLDLLQKYYHRYLNLSRIGAALLYIFNIVDASVDAHLSTFDVGDDLSFSIHPAFINTANVNRYTSGLSLNIRF